MKIRLFAALMIMLLWFAFVSSPSLAADFLGDAINKGLPQMQKMIDLPLAPATVLGLDDSTIASGLKETLSIGTKNAVGLVSQLNGYLGNAAIKILLPDRVQQAAELLGKLGYQKQVGGKWSEKLRRL